MAYLPQQQSAYEAQERRKKYYMDLLSGAVSPEQTQMVSGRAVPYSPIQGLSKIAQALMARKGLTAAEAEQQRIGEEYETGRQESSQKIIEALQGRPEQPYQLSPEEQFGGEQIPGLRTAEVEADPMKALMMSASSPYAEDKGLGTVAAALIKQKEPGKASYKVVPEMQPNGKWRNREIIDGKKAGFVGSEYTKSASAPEQKVEIGGEKYAEERLKSQAKRMDDLSKSAKASYNESMALDRFIKAAEKGEAGGAQPIITGVKNFLSSFGYGDEAMVDTRTMQQAIGDMKVTKIAQFGARGLTDKDMQIINESLPRVDTDPASRVAIAKILKKVHDREIKDYIYAVDQEKKLHPEVAGQIIPPRWLNEYQNRVSEDERQKLLDMY